MSFWQRISTDVSNAANDVYSHWIIGDDAGKSALISFIYRPTVGDNDELGMSFIEINHRAYVKSVLPGSVAYVAGVLPQDAVQLAVPIQREWEMEAAALSTNNEIDDQKDENDHQSDVYDDNWIQNINRIAKTYGLRLEKKGARTLYNQLLRLVSRHILHDDNTKIKQHFISPPTQPLKKRQQSIFSIFYSRNRRDTDNETKPSAPWDEPPTPSKLCAPIMNHDGLNNDNNSIGYQNSYLNFDRKRSASTEQSNDEDDDDFNDEKYASQQSPSAILFILRRTRQRQVLQETASCVVPTSFRLDDECDLACTLVRRLAPTADMETPIPDTWEELVHDGTDWLLGHQSMLPPKTSTTNTNQMIENGTNRNVNNRDTLATQTNATNNRTSMMETSDHDQSSIPLDAFEQIRTKKLATLRSRITTETMLIDRTDDVEAATVRAMIQKAVGLAFVRASKIVLGVSIHGGSGIVISRLPDGTWSAPSAIGTWGIGLGLQFGLEVAEYIFILQTQEAMDHFKRGGSYTVGGNMGIAIGGLGREAYGAAIVGGGCGTDTTSMATNNNSSRTLHDEQYNVENDDSRDDPERHKKRDKYYPTPSQSLGIAPIVAYAKSQGLYVGVSLEGSRIFTRDDINFRTYKFTSGNNVTADDILSGKVPTPAEAEELYAALHSVEFAHEMSRLPRPPETLRKDSANAWTYDRSISVMNKSISDERITHESTVTKRHQYPFAFLSELSTREADECSTFEAQFKNFLYGGVSVQRLIIDVEGSSNRTGKERRTLWLMLPEVGSLRIGFVSKLSDGEGVVSNKSSTQRARRDDSKRTSYDGDNATVGSEELTLDSALITKVSFVKFLSVFFCRFF
jgi:lipid-binding SYLF domain-containing protein